MNAPTTLLRSGWAALGPPAVYALMSDHGRPFMISSLFAPGSDHSTIGLVVLSVALVLCPLAAIGVALLARRRGAGRGATWTLALAGLAALTVSLTTRLPHAREWSPGPAAESRTAALEVLSQGASR